MRHPPLLVLGVMLVSALGCTALPSATSHHRNCDSGSVPYPCAPDTHNTCIGCNRNTHFANT
ncbi:MAG: hypothetical protein HW418_4365 [Anaerolineales bacterium]|nr:hypothetical protein [Anaerolineales bacterium]